MEQNGRKVSVIKNVASQMVAAVVQTVLGFVVRKIFVIYLTKDLLGLNGLMSSIIGMLSIVELGVGEAINYSLYEPLARNELEKVNAIMRLYKKIYTIIAIAIVALGLVLIPLLPLFVDTQESMQTVYLAYALFLLDTFLSYCMAYSRNIVTADQKDYIITNADTTSQIIMSVLQVIALVVTKNYFIYLAIRVAVTAIRNFLLHRLSFRMYPYLKSDHTVLLSKEYMTTLKDNVKALFVIKVAGLCVSGTDNILLSAFVSLGDVAVYANYLIIFTLINKVFNTIFDKAKSGIGNYIAVHGGENTYSLFKKIFFVNFILTSYTSIGMFALCNEVITLWLGADYVWSKVILGVLVFNNYSRYILQTCEAFRGAVGLYSPKPFVKYLAMTEGILNLVASLILIYVLEDRVLGVFLGTLISTVISTASVPWIVYRFLFKRPTREFYGIYFKYMLIGMLTLVVCSIAINVLSVSSYLLNIIIGIIICTVGTAGIYYVVFRKKEEFKYFIDLAMGIVAKIRKK